MGAVLGWIKPVLGNGCITMVELAWRPDFQGRGTIEADINAATSWGKVTRRRYVDMMEATIRDVSIGSIVLRGSYADDRISLVIEALKRVDDSAEPIHAIGTVYSQRLSFGALAFLLTDVDENEDIGPTCVMRAISKDVLLRNARPVVVVQYPHLLDLQTLALLAQMAYSRSIVLVILAVSSETLPTEFGPVSAGTGCREIIVEPLSLGEVHQALIGEFSAIPTPVVTAALHQRSQGNPGLMLALAHDAVVSGKLEYRGGYLAMNRGTWPYGGRVESVAMAQTAMLGVSERKLLQRIAVSGTLPISTVTHTELADIDRLLVAGFVTRTGKNRGEIAHSSRVLAEVFRNESRRGPIRDYDEQLDSEGVFYGFITGFSTAQRRLLEKNSLPATILHSLLDNLRNSLLDGELDEVEETIHRITRDYLDELSPELFETIVISEAILQVTSDCFHLAAPALEAMMAQLGLAAGTYDQWLIKAMSNFVQEDDERSRHTPLPFKGQWRPGRWWFTDLMMTADTMPVSEQFGDAVQFSPSGRSEVLMEIVRLRNGFVRPTHSFGHGDSAPSDSWMAEALNLVSPNRSNQQETRTLAGLESLLEAGFVVFALPQGNRILDTLTMNGKMTVAGWVKRKRKGNSPRSQINSGDLREQNYPFLEVLTKREKMVATAAALGMNNQQIASDAGVSIRTVEGHLYQIYSKLALAGRRELSSLVESLRIDNGVKV